MTTGVDSGWLARGRRGLALVTGGSGTIGQAICRGLSADGWGIGVGYVSPDRAEALAAELRASGAPAVAVPLDLTDPAATRASIARLHAANSGIAVVVFNGGATSADPFHLSDEVSWRRDIAVNFVGTVLVSELCLPHMLAAAAGHFIAVTSEAAKVGDARHASYAAAKAAQAAYLAALARRVAGTGVTANSVAPGPIESPLLRGTFASPEEAEAAIRAMQRLIPARRVGEPEDIATAVRFFARAGPGISGQHLSVSGGLTMQ